MTPNDPTNEISKTVDDVVDEQVATPSILTQPEPMVQSPVYDQLNPQIIPSGYENSKLESITPYDLPMSSFEGKLQQKKRRLFMEEHPDKQKELENELYKSSNDLEDAWDVAKNTVVGTGQQLFNIGAGIGEFATEGVTKAGQVAGDFINVLDNGSELNSRNLMRQADELYSNGEINEEVYKSLVAKANAKSAEEDRSFQDLRSSDNYLDRLAGVTGEVIKDPYSLSKVVGWDKVSDGVNNGLEGIKTEQSDEGKAGISEIGKGAHNVMSAVTSVFTGEDAEYENFDLDKALKAFKDPATLGNLAGDMVGSVAAIKKLGFGKLVASETDQVINDTKEALDKEGVKLTPDQEEKLIAKALTYSSISALADKALFTGKGNKIAKELTGYNSVKSKLLKEFGKVDSSINKKISQTKGIGEEALGKSIQARKTKLDTNEKSLKDFKENLKSSGLKKKEKDVATKDFMKENNITPKRDGLKIVALKGAEAISKGTAGYGTKAAYETLKASGKVGSYLGTRGIKASYEGMEETAQEGLAQIEVQKTLLENRGKKDPSYQDAYKAMDDSEKKQYLETIGRAFASGGVSAGVPSSTWNFLPERTKLDMAEAFHDNSRMTNDEMEASVKDYTISLDAEIANVAKATNRDPGELKKSLFELSHKEIGDFLKNKNNKKAGNSKSMKIVDSTKQLGSLIKSRVKLDGMKAMFNKRKKNKNTNNSNKEPKNINSLFKSGMDKVSEVKNNFDEKRQTNKSVKSIIELSDKIKESKNSQNTQDINLIEQKIKQIKNDNTLSSKSKKKLIKEYENRLDFLKGMDKIQNPSKYQKFKNLLESDLDKENEQVRSISKLSKKHNISLVDLTNERPNKSNKSEPKTKDTNTEKPQEKPQEKPEERQVFKPEEQDVKDRKDYENNQSEREKLVRESIDNKFKGKTNSKSILDVIFEMNKGLKESISEDEEYNTKTDSELARIFIDKLYSSALLSHDNYIELSEAINNEVNEVNRNGEYVNSDGDTIRFENESLNSDPKEEVLSDLEDQILIKQNQLNNADESLGSDNTAKAEIEKDIAELEKTINKVKNNEIDSETLYSDLGTIKTANVKTRNEEKEADIRMLQEFLANIKGFQDKDLVEQTKILTDMKKKSENISKYQNKTENLIEALEFIIKESEKEENKDKTFYTKKTFEINGNYEITYGKITPKLVENMNEELEGHKNSLKDIQEIQNFLEAKKIKESVDRRTQKIETVDADEYIRNKNKVTRNEKRLKYKDGFYTVNEILEKLYNKHKGGHLSKNGNWADNLIGLRNDLKYWSAYAKTDKKKNEYKRKLAELQAALSNIKKDVIETKNQLEIAEFKDGSKGVKNNFLLNTKDFGAHDFADFAKFLEENPSKTLEMSDIEKKIVEDKIKEDGLDKFEYIEMLQKEDNTKMNDAFQNYKYALYINKTIKGKERKEKSNTEFQKYIEDIFKENKVDYKTSDLFLTTNKDIKYLTQLSEEWDTVRQENKIKEEMEFLQGKMNDSTDNDQRIAIAKRMSYIQRMEEKKLNIKPSKTMVRNIVGTLADEVFEIKMDKENREENKISDKKLSKKKKAYRNSLKNERDTKTRSQKNTLDDLLKAEEKVIETYENFINKKESEEDFIDAVGTFNSINNYLEERNFKENKSSKLSNKINESLRDFKSVNRTFYNTSIEDADKIAEEIFELMEKLSNLTHDEKNNKRKDLSVDEMNEEKKLLNDIQVKKREIGWKNSVVGGSKSAGTLRDLSKINREKDDFFADYRKNKLLNRIDVYNQEVENIENELLNNLSKEYKDRLDARKQVKSLVGIDRQTFILENDINSKITMEVINENNKRDLPNKGIPYKDYLALVRAKTKMEVLRQVHKKQREKVNRYNKAQNDLVSNENNNIENIIEALNRRGLLVKNNNNKDYDYFTLC